MSADKVTLTTPEAARVLVQRALHDGDLDDDASDDEWDTWTAMLAAADPEALAHVALALASLAMEVARQAALVNGRRRDHAVELVQGVLDHDALPEAQVVSALAAGDNPDG